MQMLINSKFVPIMFMVVRLRSRFLQKLSGFTVLYEKHCLQETTHCGAKVDKLQFITRVSVGISEKQFL